MCKIVKKDHAHFRTTETGEIGEDGPEEGTGPPNGQTLRTVAVLEVFTAGAVEDVAWLGAPGSFFPI